MGLFKKKKKPEHTPEEPKPQKSPLDEMDPNWVVGHAYTIASYILANRRPIKEGDTVDGITDGRIDPNLQWKCHFEDALVGLGRPALGVHMDEAASGQ